MESGGESGGVREDGAEYMRAGKLPSQMEKRHTWRTREDPFGGVWEEVRGMLKESEGGV